MSWSVRRYSESWWVAALIALACGGAAESAAQSTARTLAEYPNGTFLENVVADGLGALVYTSYFGKTLEILEPGKPARTLARLDLHPVGIVSYRDGYLLSAHGAPFNSGPDFTRTQQLVVLGADGAVKSTFAAPEARFLNGMVTNRDGTILVADSIAATIWAVDPAAKSVTPWFKDAALAQDAQAKEFRPGANGLKFQGEKLLISNSSLGTLSVVVVAANGKPGTVTTLARTGPIDDFLVTAEGDVLFTTHGSELKRRRADGTIETVMSGCDGCTSLAPFKSGGQVGYAVLTTGGLLEGGKSPARVLFVQDPAK
jgi:hypothetical protein